MLLPLFTVVGMDYCEEDWYASDNNLRGTHVVENGGMISSDQHFVSSVRVKVKQSRYRPGVTQRVPGS